MDNVEKEMLEKQCGKMRRDCLLMAKAAGGEGFHFGATLSIIEIIAVLYLKVMRIKGDSFLAEERDRFILSKGHGVPAVYAVLKQMGVLSEEELMTFKSENTRLYGHPCKNEDLGIEFSSGSLGQGLSYGVGKAIALQRKRNNFARVFVLLGDGECNEGSVWEAAMSAVRYQLDNLVVIIDRNHLQYDGDTEQIMPLDDLEKKWNSFGWKSYVIDGHNVEQCYEAFQKREVAPMVIIADTIKGKGISFMENVASWHHGIMTKEQESQAWSEVTERDN